MSEAMDELKKEQENECQIKQQINNSGEADLMCSGGIGEECDSCEKKKKVEERLVFQTGGQKINAEAEEQYKKANGKESAEMMKAQMAPIIEYVTKKCEENTEYNALVLQSHKTWERCYKFMSDKAYKMAESGSKGLLVNGMTVLKWIDEYYLQDDKAEVEKELAKAEKKKEADAEVKKKAKEDNEKKAKEAAEKKKAKEAEKSKTGKNNGFDGQFSIFDMMGG